MPEEEPKVEGEEEAKAEEDAEMKEPKEEEEEEAAAEEAKAKPPEPKELEVDAVEDSRGRVKAEELGFLTEDTTLNVLVTTNSRLLTSLSDGGCQYLLAGARTNVGLKAGRHFFEVQIVENKNPSEPAGARSQGPKPRQLVRLGVSSSHAALLLSDNPDSVAFDSDGFFLQGTSRKKVGQKFSHSQVVGFLLNLDEKSTNANTVSLFVSGQRASEPQPLPEALRGKALFPAVTYRNVTLQAHFGPQPLKTLPFKCRTWLDAAAADCEVKKLQPSGSGPCEVLIPVGLPDEGPFDWIDQFLSQNRSHVELSDRSILEWARKSGVQRPGGYLKRTSNDRPDPAFGMPLMDDGSIRRVLTVVAPSQPRNYVVAQVKGNLTAEDRQAMLARFMGPQFRRVACIMMGEPPQEFRTWVHDGMLKEKRIKAETEAKRKKAEAQRKKAEEEKRKKATEDRKRKLEASKKGKDKKEEEEAKAEPEEEVKPEVADEAEAEVKVELSDEEKASVYWKKETPDLDAKELSASYANFSLATKEEGFDEVKFVWAGKTECEDYLRKWILERKRTQRIEELTPSEWFKGKWTEWTKSLGAWKKKQADWKDPKKKAVTSKKKDAEEEEPEKPKSAPEDLDVFAVEDVMDIGGSEPLFAHWVFEDWSLLSLRFELHLLVHSFRNDVDDADRTNFHQDHLSFYYHKYFKKPFNVKYFGVGKLSELIDLIKDTVEINSKTSMLESQLSNDTPMENFVKLTEDHRRDRQRRLDAGDETAQLKFTRPAPAAPPPGRQGTQAQKSWSSQGRGGDDHRGSHGGGGHSAYGSQKRSYGPSSYPPSKQQRSYGTGQSRYGGYEGGGYYKR